MNKLSTYLTILLCAPASAFFIMPGTQSTRNELKGRILDLAAETERGLKSTPEQEQEILENFEKLERLNPSTKNPLTTCTNKVNGD